MIPVDIHFARPYLNFRIGVAVSEFEELEAMKKIAAALDPLDDAARARALQWASSRFCAASTMLPTLAGPRSGKLGVEPVVSGSYPTFAELFDAANPRTERDKALI